MENQLYHAERSQRILIRLAFLTDKTQNKSENKRVSRKNCVETLFLLCYNKVMWYLCNLKEEKT